jgi:hypothetical protein
MAIAGKGKYSKSEGKRPQRDRLAPSHGVCTSLRGAGIYTPGLEAAGTKKWGIGTNVGVGSFLIIRTLQQFFSYLS